MDEEDKEKTEKINKEFDTEDTKIIKDPLIGFLVVKYIRKDGSFYIGTEPLSASWDGFDDNDYMCNDNDQIIGVLPAPPYSYKVLGLFPCMEENLPYPRNGSYECLGYEFAGAYSPDWKKLLEDRIKELEKRRNIEEKLKKGDTNDLSFEEGYGTNARKEMKRYN